MPTLLRIAKEHGFSDAQIAQLRGIAEAEVRGIRARARHPPGLTRRSTPARGSSRRSRRTTTRATTWRPRWPPSERTKVVIIGSGPNRIGQGVEFDYSCVHASFALSDAGYETIMVNCNPETVSTDYDTSDRLYFEPLTLEDVLEVLHAESAVRRDPRRHRASSAARPPLGLAKGLKDAGYRSSARALRPSTSPRSAAVRRHPRRRRPARAAQRHGDGRRTAPSRSPRTSATRCSSARATCSAAAAWRSSTTAESLRDYFDRIAGRRSSSRARRCWSTGSSTTPSRSTSTRSTTAPSCTSAASWSTSRRPASTPATRAAPCRR